MSYEIIGRSDFTSGTTLIVSIPEAHLDRKAVLTIQSDRPDFILPFHYRRVDGHYEFVYQTGSRSSLQYLSGALTPSDFALLWSGILSPLLLCGDWFLKPYSFVLNTRYLYYDADKKAACYVYIPSIHDYSTPESLKLMAVELSKQISVNDTGLENLVLRSILKDFCPEELMQILKPYFTHEQHNPHTAHAAHGGSHAHSAHPSHGARPAHTESASRGHSDRRSGTAQGHAQTTVPGAHLSSAAKHAAAPAGGMLPASAALTPSGRLIPAQAGFLRDQQYSHTVLPPQFVDYDVKDDSADTGSDIVITLPFGGKSKKERKARRV